MTANMPMEMVDDVTEQADEHGVSRAEYIRFLIRQADDPHFAVPEQSFTTTVGEEEGPHNDPDQGNCAVPPAETTRALVRSVWSAPPNQNP